MHKWSLVPLANCRCGAEEQTADYILASFPLYHPPNGPGLAALDDDTVGWLKRNKYTQYLMTRLAQTKKKKMGKKGDSLV